MGIKSVKNAFEYISVFSFWFDQTLKPDNKYLHSLASLCEALILRNTASNKYVVYKWLIFHILGRFKEAVKDQERVISLQPDFTSARECLKQSKEEIAKKETEVS